jgi:hypothetical protein
MLRLALVSPAPSQHVNVLGAWPPEWYATDPISRMHWSECDAWCVL